MPKRIVESEEEEEEIDLISDDEDLATPSKNSTKASAGTKKTNKNEALDELIEDLEEEEEEIPVSKKSSSSSASLSKKKKQKRDESEDEDDDEDFDEESEDEDAKKKKKKATAAAKKKKTVTTKTRKGTTVEFTAGADGASMPRTKKEAAAAKKAARDDADGIAIASGDPLNPVRVVPYSDPVVEKFNKMTISLLKDWCRANQTLVSGTKPDLVARCVDGAMNGRLPRCERCSLGKIAFNADKGIYTCGGYFDEDARMMIRCSFQEPTVKRLEWVDPDTAAAAGGAEAKEAEKKESETSSSAAITDEFVASVVALGPKEATDVVAKFCKEELKLSLPEDDKKSRLLIGPMIMSNRDDGKYDVRKVIGLLAVSHPPKPADDATGAAAATAKAGGGAKSKIPENEPIAALLEELAQWEKKKGGENVGFKIASLKKAALTIRGLSYEITDGTSMGKPGKSKVENIGKGTAKTIQEFLDSGKTVSPYLESLKKDVGE